MQYLTSFYHDGGMIFYVVAGVAVLVVAAIVLLLYRLIFRRGIKAPGNGRSRQVRLGVVDVHVLDSSRQLVLVRRDNVEHLIMIGGPNDLLVESQIVRVEARPVREREGQGVPVIAATAPGAANAPAPAQRQAQVAREGAPAREAPVSSQPQPVEYGTARAKIVSALNAALMLPVPESAPPPVSRPVPVPAPPPVDPPVSQPATAPIPTRAVPAPVAPPVPSPAGPPVATAPPADAEVPTDAPLPVIAPVRPIVPSAGPPAPAPLAITVPGPPLQPVKSPANEPVSPPSVSLPAAMPQALRFPPMNISRPLLRAELPKPVNADLPTPVASSAKAVMRVASAVPQAAKAQPAPEIRQQSASVGPETAMLDSLEEEMAKLLGRPAR